MKIGIIALGLGTASAGGAEIYFRELVRNLRDFDGGKENEYYVFLNNRAMRDDINSLVNPRMKVIYFHPWYTSLAGIFLMMYTRPKTVLRLLVNEFFRLLFSKKPYEVDVTGIYGKIIDLDRFKMDLYHFPLNTIDPSFMNIKTPIALTMHDIQHEYYPEFFHRDTLDLRHRIYKTSSQRADVIITISETTKKTLVDKYNTDPNKVVVAYQGCSKDFKIIEEEKCLEEIRKKYGLPDEFLFYPAGTWPHKNHARLLRAMVILNQRYAFHKALVLTGICQDNHNSVIEMIKGLELTDQVKFLDFVPFRDLPVIFNLATVMVFPSLFEGFGIPLLEAMIVGLPIACSDRTSIPEVVGDAGVYFDPENEEDIAEKLYQLWQDKALQENTARKGFERAKLFTWKRAIEKTVASYERAEKIITQ